MKNILIKILIFLIFFIILAVFIYFLTNKESRLSKLEDLNIVYVSENYDSLLVDKDNSFNFFINKNGNVYILVDKELRELKSLYGAKKIITTVSETIVLMHDGMLYAYNPDSDELNKIKDMDNCKDIANGKNFYAIIKNNGEVWLSRDIATTDENSPIDSNYGKTTEFKKIEMNTKAKEICCNNYHQSDNIGTSICIIDENGDLWGYGQEFMWTKNPLLKINKDEKINKISGNSMGLLISEGKAYLISHGYFCLDIHDCNNIVFDKEMVINEILEKVTDVSVGYTFKGYIKTENGVLYGIEYHIDKYELIKMGIINPEAKLFPTSYGVIVIDNNNNIKLFRNYSIIEEWSYNNIKIRSDEILPLCDLF